MQLALDWPPPLIALSLPLFLSLLLLTWASSVAIATGAAVGALGLAAFLIPTSPEPERPSAESPRPRQAPADPRPGPPGRRLPLSARISADYSSTVDYSDAPNGAGDLPDSLFHVVQQATNPLELPHWRYAEQKVEEATRIAHFAWTVPRWKAVTELESPEFREPLIEGVTWRILLRRASGLRLLLLVKAAQLDPAHFPEGRLFAEVSCSCQGLGKSTFAAFYPGQFELALVLDTRRLDAAPGTALTVACNAAIFAGVRVHSLAPRPPTCGTDRLGRYVTYHSAGLRWHVADWARFAWETGWGVFSPLFCAASLPGYLWQLHLFPASDDPDSAGLVSAFVKLADSTGVAGAEAEVEVDFRLILQGDAENALADTVCFVRGDAHGFRGVRRLGDLLNQELMLECALRIKVPLFS